MRPRLTAPIRWGFGLLLCTGLHPTPLAAQGLPIPPTWRWVTDEPARVVNTPAVPDSAFRFVMMAPGWHVTMGPGGVLFDPRYFVEGGYVLESEVFLFPDSGQGQYGFFVGGTDLEGAGSRYVAFVLRGDGSVAAWEQRGGNRRVLSDWQPAGAVRPGEPNGVVRNLIRLVVTRQEAVFKANGLDVLILPRGDLGLEGQFGFRIGRGTNLHASTLNVTSRLAPARE